MPTTADAVPGALSGPGRWVRSAFWIGRPLDNAAFRAAIVDDLVPRLRALPGVSGADALWPELLEDGSPAIHCQILVHFASAANLHRMLASPERAAMRDGVRALAERFDGRLSHIDYRLA